MSRHVEADVYDAAHVLGEGRFVLVDTGIGALCWLPSVARWAETVAALSKPSGELCIREGHPVQWALDDPRPDGLPVLAFPYFETAGVRFTEEATYGDHDEPLASPDIVHFDHGLVEIFDEHDTVPWNPMGDAMRDVGGGEFRLVDRPERLPCSYTLRARQR